MMIFIVEPVRQPTPPSIKSKPVHIPDNTSETPPPGNII